MNESWGNTKDDTRVSKCGLRSVQVDFGFTLRDYNVEMVLESERGTNRIIPFGKELEDLILALLRQPGLPRHEQLYLMKIDAQDLRRKHRHKMLSEWSIFLGHRAGQLRWIAEPADGEIR